MTALPDPDSPPRAVEIAPGSTVPTARAMRAALRRARRRSGAAKTLSETLQDLYVTLFAIVLVAIVAGPAAARALGDVGARSTSAALAGTLTLAALLAAVGGGLGALVLVGPVVRDPADVTWLLSSPVRRRGLLAPTVALLVGVSAVCGGLAGAAGSLLVPGARVTVWTAAGLCAGALVASVAVIAQPHGRARIVIRRAATGLTIAAVVVLASGLSGIADSLHTRGQPSPWWLALPFAAAVLVLLALPRALQRLRRQDLVAGAGLALGIRATVTALDGSFIAETMRARRLLEHGTVRPHALWGTGRQALVAADLRRAVRSPRALLTAAALVCATWLVSDLYGRIAGVAALALAAWGSAGAVSSGLRMLARSRGLARSLPFSDQKLRSIQCVVPGALAAVVSLAAAALSGLPLWYAGPATAIGLAGVLRTSAGRAPVKWELQAESPMGAMPVGAVMSYLVGVDVVAVTTIPLLLRLDPAICLGLPVAAAMLLTQVKRKD